MSLLEQVIFIQVAFFLPFFFTPPYWLAWNSVDLRAGV